jgi:hypothetical protein
MPRIEADKEAAREKEARAVGDSEATVFASPNDECGASIPLLINPLLHSLANSTLD